MMWEWIIVLGIGGWVENLVVLLLCATQVYPDEHSDLSGQLLWCIQGRAVCQPGSMEVGPECHDIWDLCV